MDLEALRARLPERLDKTIQIRVSSAWLAEVDALVAELRAQGLMVDRSMLIRNGAEAYVRHIQAHKEAT